MASFAISRGAGVLARAGGNRAATTSNGNSRFNCNGGVEPRRVTKTIPTAARVNGGGGGGDRFSAVAIVAAATRGYTLGGARERRARGRKGLRSVVYAAGSDGAAAAGSKVSIGDMKAALVAASVDTSTCYERAELAAKYEELSAAQKAAGAGGTGGAGAGATSSEFPNFEAESSNKAGCPHASRGTKLKTLPHSCAWQAPVCDTRRFCRVQLLSVCRYTRCCVPCLKDSSSSSQSSSSSSQSSSSSSSSSSTSSSSGSKTKSPGDEDKESGAKPGAGPDASVYFQLAHNPIVP